MTFTIKWPAATASAAARGRRPHYLPATALSASVGIYGGTPQYINSPTSTLTFTAPVGLDTFLVQSYDEQNGKGNVLSSANITQTVTSTKANILAATLNGVIASLKLVLSTYTTPAGSSRNVAVAASGLDADGNTIVGPGDFNEPITLSIVDPANSGTLSLSKTILQAPGAGSTSTLAYNGGSLLSASIVASAAGVPSVSATFAPTLTFKQFAPTGRLFYPENVTAGPDGNIWFTDYYDAVGKITPAGTITEYPVMTAHSFPFGITAASDGRIWFTEVDASKVGAITTSGTVSEYTTAIPQSQPVSIVDRGDGTVWYGGAEFGSLESIPLAGGTPMVWLDYDGVNPPESINGVTVAPNQDVFFIGQTQSQVGRLSNLYAPSGRQVDTVNVPSAGTFIVLGPDGNLWFPENTSSQIGTISPLGFTTVTQYSTLSLHGGPYGITAGTDGALWFTEQNSNRIGRVTTSGVMTEYQLPGFTNVKLSSIATAKDGSLWFVEGGALGHLVY